MKEFLIIWQELKGGWDLPPLWLLVSTNMQEIALFFTVVYTVLRCIKIVIDIFKKKSEENEEAVHHKGTQN